MRDYLLRFTYWREKGYSSDQAKALASKEQPAPGEAMYVLEFYLHSLWLRVTWPLRRWFK